MDKKNEIDIYKIILISLLVWFCISFYNFSRNGKFSSNGNTIINTRTGQLYTVDKETGKILTFEKYKNK
jgi:glucose dehydrogenase